MGIFGLLIIGMVLTLLLYLLRNILALPFQLVFRLCGIAGYRAKTLSQMLIGETGSLIAVFFSIAVIIWAWPVVGPAFGSIGENLMWFVRHIPDAVGWAVSCWTGGSC